MERMLKCAQIANNLVKESTQTSHLSNCFCLPYRRFAAATFWIRPFKSKSLWTFSVKAIVFSDSTQLFDADRLHLLVCFTLRIFFWDCCKNVLTLINTNFLCFHSNIYKFSMDFVSTFDGICAQFGIQRKQPKKKLKNIYIKANAWNNAIYWQFCWMNIWIKLCAWKWHFHKFKGKNASGQIFFFTYLLYIVPRSDFRHFWSFHLGRKVEKIDEYHRIIRIISKLFCKYNFLFVCYMLSFASIWLRFLLSFLSF